MAIRRRQVLPDETGVVSQEALIQAMIEAASWLDFAGGMIQVITGRAPTNLQGEMVTTGAVIVWQDRTDAKPQPEQASTVTAKPDPEGFKYKPEAQAEEPDEKPMEFVDVPAAPAEASADNPDGFDYDQLEAEDVETEPEAVR